MQVIDPQPHEPSDRHTELPVPRPDTVASRGSLLAFFTLFHSDAQFSLRSGELKWKQLVESSIRPVADST